MGSAAGGTDVDDFDLLTSNRAQQTASPLGRSGSPFDMSGLDGALPQSNGGAKPKKSPESFLGPNSNLVNLENLVKSDNVIIRRVRPFFRLVLPFSFVRPSD